jgi:hypothetical protein
VQRIIRSTPRRPGAEGVARSVAVRLALVQFGLQSLMEAGLIEEQPVDPLAHLVIGALSEAAVVIAQAEDTEAARIEMGAALERLMAGLRVDAGATRSAGRAAPRRPGRARG